MLCHGSFCRLNCIGLGIYTGSHTSCMTSPIVHKSRHMYNLFGIVGEAQNHIMVLTSVKFGAEAPDLVKKLAAEYRQMADIVDAAEAIGGVFGFEVDVDDLFDVGAFKGSLVGINEVGSLIADCTHDLKESSGMQNIVVVKTLSGMANAIAVCLETLNIGEVVGSVAGDDTILLVMKNSESALATEMALKAEFE